MQLAPFLLLLHLFLQYASVDFLSRFLALFLLSRNVFQMISASHWLLHVQTSSVESDCCCLLSLVDSHFAISLLRIRHAFNYTTAHIAREFS